MSDRRLRFWPTAFRRFSARPLCRPGGTSCPTGPVTSNGPVQIDVVVKIMLDSDLASLYEVETKALVRAVKRNLDRFPGDFMFQLSQVT